MNRQWMLELQTIMASRDIKNLSDLFDRMDGLANVKQQEALKVLIRSLSVEWLNEGFYERDVRDYIDYLIRMELKEI